MGAVRTGRPNGRPPILGGQASVLKHVRCPPVLAAALEAEAKHRGVTEADLMRMLLSAVLTKRDPYGRERETYAGPRVKTKRRAPQRAPLSLVAHPLEALTEQRSRPPARHDLVHTAHGAVCARCGARPEEDSPCLP